MPDARWRRVAVPLAFAGVAIGGWFVWSHGGRPVAPPAVVEVGVGEVDRTTVAAAEVGAPAAAVARDELSGGRVQGRLFDAQDQPLVGWPVWLERSRRQHVDDRTGVDGGFAFEDVAPGHYRAYPYDGHELGIDLDVLDGEASTLELRLPAGSCAVEAHVTVDGGTPADVRLRIDLENGGTRTMQPDRRGLARSLLPVGAHLLRTALVDHRRDAVPDCVLDERPLGIGNRTAALRCQVDVVLPVLQVEVDYGAAAAVTDLAVVATGTLRFGGDARTLRSRASSARGASLSVPPGRWSVAVESQHLQAMPPQELEIAPGQRRAQLRFVGERAEVVQLVLRLGDGRPFCPVLPATWLPCLDPSWNGDRIVPCVELEPAGGFGAPAKLALATVPLGAGNLQWSDRDVDGRWSFLPFAPLPPTAVQVLAGGANELTLVVEPRARVELVACEHGGRELLQGALHVFVGNREVQSRATLRPTRFESFLPPGEYRVVIDHPGGTTERQVQVQARNLQLRLRL